VVLGPVSVEDTLLLVFVYEPAVAPVTVTEIVQLPPPESDPPENEIVRGFVLVSVPPQTDEVPLETVNPEGRTSVNEMPLRDVLALGLVTVNVNVPVLPVLIVVGKKLLDMVGTVGRGQPVMEILSSPTEALLSFAPLKIIRKVVVPVPVEAAV